MRQPIDDLAAIDELQGRLGLLERERELAALRAMIGRADGGLGTSVIVEGPAGAGKTSLLRAAEALAAEQGLTTLAAHGSELETGIPFGVVRQLLPAVDLAATELSATTDRERRAALITRLRDELVRAIGGDDDQRPTPHLLRVDDAQWADAASLAFLAHLALRAASMPLVVVLGVRTGEHPEPPELDHLRRTTPAHVIAPRQLTTGAVEELVRRRWGDDVSDRLVAACAESTGGNPFYLCELLRHLDELGAGPTAGDVATAAPASVLRALLARLAALGDDHARLAIALSVIGDGVPLSWAAELADLTPAAAESAADALATAELMTPGEPLALAHPLIGSALRSDMGTFALARAHRRAAEVMRRAGAASEQIAGQLVPARPANDPATVATLREAAAIAREHGDPAAAVTLLRRALAEPPGPADRAGVLSELARAEAVVGDPGATAHLEQALALLDDPRARAAAIGDLARLLQWSGDFDGAVALARRGRAELPENDPAAPRLHAVALGTALLLPSLHEEANAELDELAREAAEGKLPHEPSLLALLAARLAYGDGDGELATSIARAAFANDPLVDDGSQGMALAFAGIALVDLDHPEVAAPLIADAVTTAQRRGAVLTGAVAQHLHALLDLRRGELESALAHAERSLTVYRDGWVEIPWAAPALVSIHVERGDLDAAADAVARYDVPGLVGIARARMLESRARLSLARGADTVALADATEAIVLVRDASGGVHVPLRGSDAVHLAARAAHRHGDEARARGLLDELTERLAQVRAPHALGLTLAGRASLAGDDRRLPLLVEAIDALGTAGSTLAQLHVQTELGIALHESGDAARAREHLSAVYEHAERIGARPLSHRARVELWALGVRPRRAARSGVESLTASEYRIAALAADGLSTPQIAHELYITRKTVESHLSRVYRKLDVRGRAQLPAVLAAGD